MAKESKRLSIIIPAYKEEATIAESIKEVISVFPEAEVIVVDDGSGDSTFEIAKTFEKENLIVVQNKINRGKGYSIKRGALAASGEKIVFTDADLPFGTEGIKKVVERLDGRTSVVIAEKKDYQKTIFYNLGKSAVRFLIRALFGFTYNDTQAGLKGFKKEAASYIFKRTFISRFAFDVEVLELAKKGGLSVQTVPLAITERQFRLSSFNPLKEGIMFIFDLLMIKGHRYQEPGENEFNL